jgi:hypothetical protein
MGQSFLEFLDYCISHALATDQSNELALLQRIRRDAGALLATFRFPQPEAPVAHEDEASGEPAPPPPADPVTPTPVDPALVTPDAPAQ